MKNNKVSSSVCYLLLFRSSYYHHHRSWYFLFCIFFLDRFCSSSASATAMATAQTVKARRRPSRRTESSGRGRGRRSRRIRKGSRPFWYPETGIEVSTFPALVKALAERRERAIRPLRPFPHARDGCCRPQVLSIILPTFDLMDGRRFSRLNNRTDLTTRDIRKAPLDSSSSIDSSLWTASATSGV